MFDFFNDYIDGGERLLKNLKILMNPVHALTAPLVLFKKSAGDWLVNYENLKKLDERQLSNDLITERHKLLNSGAGIVSKIKTMGFYSDNLQRTNLGFVPVIAGGVVVAAAGLMAYWTTDYLKFKDKFAEYKSLIDSGMSHEQASKVVKELTESGGIFSGLEGVAKNAAIAGGLFVAYKLAQRKGLIK